VPRLKWLDVCGLRSFGVEQTLSFEHPVALIWGGNSQGKTSIAEAVEFLLTGTIVRRVMLGGAKNEYEHSLRNVYHPTADKAFVRAGIEDPDGNEHQVERELLSDFERNQECQSRLWLDGAEVGDLSSIGVELAEPPLRAPVLFQHSLRYVLSAAPSERLTYFKALLEVSDLDMLADELKSAIDALPVPSLPLDGDLTSCLADTDLAPLLAVFRDGIPPSPAVARQRLEQGVRLGVERLTGASSHGGLTFAQAVERLNEEVQRHEQRRFDFAAWRSGQLPDWSEMSFDRCRTYSAVAGQVDAEAERLRALFEAVLQVPALGALDAPTVCPVCDEGTLTPARIAALRAQVAGATDLREKQAAAQRELAAARAPLAGLPARADALAPRAQALSDEQLEVVDASARTILAEHKSLHGIRETARRLQENAATLRETAELALQRIDDAIDAVRETHVVDVDVLTQILGHTQAALNEAVPARTAYTDAAAEILVPIKNKVDEQIGTSQWSCLLRLAEDPGALIASLRQRLAVTQAKQEFLAAHRDIERAKLEVFRDKFAAMSGEILRWWQLLRPDEPVSFDRAAPRGEGRRYVDMKAKLHANGHDEERDALGIFSDSQLNALGLAAFLARATLQQSPFILLDDPVQSGDDEHRDTFIDVVLPELISIGLQVIITSHDSHMRTLMTNAHTLDGFTVTLDEPHKGTVVIRGTDTAEALLDEAKAFIRDTPSLRDTGAQKLRVAAERLAKEILVQKRHENGERASLADYRKHTLEKLVPKLCDVLADEKEQGMWKNISPRLSPGAHDDAPPAKNTLKTVRDQLVTSHKRHVKDPQLGRTA
jgi:hypothetical protein